MFKRVGYSTSIFTFNGSETFSGFRIMQVQIDGIWYETDMICQWDRWAETEKYVLGIVVEVGGIRHSVELDERVFEKITDWN